MRILNRTEKYKYSILIVYVLTFLMLTGNIVSSGIRFCGMVLSAYRVTIPLVFLVFISVRMRKRALNDLFQNRILLLYCSFIVFWIIWGMVLLFVSPYVNIKDALKDLLSLALGVTSIYCFWEICDSEDALKIVFRCIRVVCMVLCVWAMIEILTGFYLPFSKYCWLNSVEKRDWLAVILRGLKDKSLNPATTIFHNMNDFSTFLAIFLPLFYVSQEKTKKENLLHGMGFFFMVFIIGVNDSNIATIGIAFAIVIYFILNKDRKIIGGFLAIYFVFISIGNKLICSVLILIKSSIPIEVPVSAQKYGSILELIRIKDIMNVKEVMEVQMTDAVGGSANSLMCRWQITLTSLRMTLKSKLLGIGPSGFTNYIETHEKDSLLHDPHNWWLEILSQYGIVVLGLYIIIMASIFIGVWRIYKKMQSHIELMFLCMCLTFCFACIAPSSYLGFTYQWLLPAVGISIIGYRNESVKNGIILSGQMMN